MKYFIPLFIIIPALEIGILLLAGNTIGVFYTVLLIIFTGVFGAYLMKKQGIEALQSLGQQIQKGVPPGEVIINGICILVGGLLLLTPGFITDITGLYLLIPITRKTIMPFIKKLIMNWMNKNTFTIIR